MSTNMFNLSKHAMLNQEDNQWNGAEALEDALMENKSDYSEFVNRFISCVYGHDEHQKMKNVIIEENHGSHVRNSLSMILVGEHEGKKQFIWEQAVYLLHLIPFQ